MYAYVKYGILLISLGFEDETILMRADFVMNVSKEKTAV